ncbi:EamA family transporter [Allokutzneria sp. A3M-2-11 16]|uniref:DMT family transporter n=1 Tax=Allokutzneria sp. A3M-2-11 16 TaxID=2962043 RepID=UPI0020B89DAD|nr:EamA family transporter [Allokutzneria sp. A3M-2-11 16]MCP3798800.1 EamA family transporter [Allokutzneria sp. A3M-2-11 16]
MTSSGSLIRIGVLGLLWGSSFLWIELALHALSPVQIVFVRVGLGALVLVAICRAMKLSLPRGGRTWAHLGVAAVFANVLPFILFGVGQQTVDSSMAGVLNATTPLWTLLISVTIGQEKSFGPLRVLGLVLGFAGVMLIFAPWQDGAGSALPGSIAILVAALSYGIGAVYVGRNLSGKGMSPTSTAAGQMIMAAALTGVVIPVGGLQPVHWEVTSGLIAAVILGVFGTGLSFMLFVRLIADEGATATSTVTYLMPVVSVALGAIVLGEQLSPRVVLGMLVVLGGVMLTRPRRAKAPVVVPPAETAKATSE